MLNIRSGVFSLLILQIIKVPPLHLTMKLKYNIEIYEIGNLNSFII